MTQATSSTSAANATTVIPRPEPRSLPRTTITATLEDNQRRLLIKHLAALIRQARDSPTILEGDRDEHR